MTLCTAVTCIRHAWELGVAHGPTSTLARVTSILVITNKGGHFMFHTIPKDNLGYAKNASLKEMPPQMTYTFFRLFKRAYSNAYSAVRSDFSYVMTCGRVWNAVRCEMSMPVGLTNP